MSVKNHNQLKMTKMRHSSLDLADREIKKKNSDMLSRARNKLLNIGDALKSKKDENQNKTLPKSMTQCTLDYFFKQSKNNDYNKPGSKILSKQISVGSNPQIQISSFDSDIDEGDEVFLPINPLRPATVCVDQPSVDRRSDADALALERPRKKLSFKEPMVDNRKQKHKNTIANSHVNNNDTSGHSKLQSTIKSCEKILKHVGKSDTSHTSDPKFTLGKGIQSIAGLGISVVTNGVQRVPSFEDTELESQAMRVVRTVGQAFEVCHKLSINAPKDNFDDEQDTTLTQDFLSDRLSDVASDKPKKDITLEGANSDKNSLPPDDSSLKDTYPDSSIKKIKPPAHLEILPPPPTNSSSSRKTSPLQAETYASPHSKNLASDSTTPSQVSNSLPSPGTALSSHHEIQLLREQLDQQRQQTQAAMAQLQLAREQLQAEQTARMEAQARTHQLLVHNRELLDHIAGLVAHLQGGDKSGQQPISPPHMTMPQDNLPPDQIPQLDPLVLQALNLPSGIYENRATPQSPIRSTFNPAGGGLFNFSYPPTEMNYENQFLQRLGYPPMSPQYPYNYPTMMNQWMPPPQYNPYASLPRSFSNIGNSSRHSEPRQMYNNQEQIPKYSQLSVSNNMQRRHSSINLQAQDAPNRMQMPVSPKPPESSSSEAQFIKPLSQVGTLTTTDSEGRVRVIVPVPSNSEDGDLLSNLRISDELRLMNGPGVSRSTSERVPNRSELMSQMQRTMWARHTTK